jgi:hypothetical protein
MIPAIDIEITDPTTIDDLIAAAKDHDRVKNFDLERFQSVAPTQEELA